MDSSRGSNAAPSSEAAGIHENPREQLSKSLVSETLAPGLRDTPEPLAAQPARTSNPKRIFIGNLPTNVSEFALVKLFEPFGKIKGLEYLFHKSGPLMGLPKGYAFIEYEDGESAIHAIARMHGKRLSIKGKKGEKEKSRPLVVSFSLEPAVGGDLPPAEPPAGLTGRPAIGAAPYGSRSALRNDAPRREARFSSYTSTDSGRGRGGHRGGYSGRGAHIQQEASRGMQLKTNARLANASTETKIEALERRLRMLDDEGSNK